jgi:hypothetical protein
MLVSLRGYVLAQVGKGGPREQEAGDYDGRVREPLQHEHLVVELVEVHLLQVSGTAQAAQDNEQELLDFLCGRSVTSIRS